MSTDLHSVDAYASTRDLENVNPLNLLLDNAPGPYQHYCTSPDCSGYARAQHLVGLIIVSLFHSGQNFV